MDENGSLVLYVKYIICAFSKYAIIECCVIKFKPIAREFRPTCIKVRAVQHLMNNAIRVRSGCDTHVVCLCFRVCVCVYNIYMANFWVRTMRV